MDPSDFSDNRDDAGTGAMCVTEKITGELVCVVDAAGVAGMYAGIFQAQVLYGTSAGWMVIVFRPGQDDVEYFLEIAFFEVLEKALSSKNCMIPLNLG